MTAFALQIRKEVRALLPWWLCVAVGVAAGAVLARQHAGFPHFRHDYDVLVVMMHAVGVLAVATLSFGHELTHGTLPSLLAQPIARRRVLSTKLLVLGAAVVILGVGAEWWLLERFLYLSGGAAARTLVIWGPVVAAIGLVPLLTVLTRKPLGGFVFSIALPGLVFVAGQKLYSVRDAWSISWYGTLALSVIGVALLFHQYQRLEVGGDGAGIAAPRMTSREPAPVVPSPTRRAKRRSWVWLVMTKELRLQRLTFSVSGLYIVAAALVQVARGDDPAYVGPTFYAVSAVHGVFIPLLAGCVASAEERHLGVLAPNALLPQAAWRQWLIKVVVTMTLVVGLAAGLPMLLMLIHRPVDPFSIETEFVVGILLLTSAALYISSLSSNSLLALLVALPAIWLAVILGTTLLDSLSRPLSDWLGADAERRRVSGMRLAPGTTDWSPIRRQIFTVIRIEITAYQLLTAGLGVLALFFGGQNHKSLDRTVRTIARQVMTLLLYVCAAVVILVAIQKIAWASIR
jgi:hypothetical protein